MSELQQVDRGGLVRFGPFGVDRARYLLTRSGQKIELPRIAMEVLLVLVEQPGLLVTRGQLVQAVWPGADLQEKEQGINTAVTRIRAALRDDPAKPRYIETVIGKGYRFIAELQMPTRGEDSAEPDAEPAVVAVAADGEAEPVAGVRQPTPLPIRRTFSGRAVWVSVVLAVVVVVGIGMLAWVWRGWSGGATGSRGEFRLAAAVPLTLNYINNRAGATSISPDGERVVFADADGLKLLGRHELAPVKLRALPLRIAIRIAWFPDGDRLLVSGMSLLRGAPEVWLTSSSGSVAPRLLRSDAQNASPSPDGSRVLFLSGSGHELWEMGADGGGLRLLLASSTGEELSEPIWLPGGKLLLLQRRPRATEKALVLNPNSPSEESEASVLVLRERDGTIAATYKGVAMASPCAYADGTILYVSMAKNAPPLNVLKLDLRTGAFVSPPKALPVPGGANVGQVSVAANGETALVLQTGRAGVFVASLADSGQSLIDAQPLSSAAHAAYPHAWTPDSRSVVFEQERDGKWWLLKQKVVSHDAESFGDAPLEGIMARPSPNHRWLLFYRQSTDNAPLQLFRVRLAKNAATGEETARGQAEPLAVPTGETRCPSTGTRCVLRVKDAARRQVQFFAIDPENRKTELRRTLSWAENNFGDWDVSPDGTEVVVCAGTSQPGELRLFSLRNQSERALHFPVYAPFRAVNWQASGAGWFASFDGGPGSILYHLTADGLAVPLHTMFAGTWAVPSPDGQKLAYVDLNSDRNIWITRPEFSVKR